MSDIAILKDMIQDRAILPLEVEQNGKKLNYKITLRESQSGLNNSYEITINGMPNDDNVIVIKADSLIDRRQIFKGKKGESKCADFVIIANTKIGKFIVCLEMKKTKGQSKEISQQLTGAQCLVIYCQEIGKKFWHQDNFLNAYQYRFVSISHISMAKTTTRYPSQKRQSNSTQYIHDHPDRMLKVSAGNRLDFYYLLEGNNGN